MANDALVEQLSEGAPLTDAAACLAPLLDSLSWRGTPRQLAEAMAAPWELTQVDDLRNTLANLSFRSTSKSVRLDKIDPRLLPCVFEANSGDVMVLWNDSFGNVIAYDARTRKIVDKFRRNMKGTAYFFVPVEETAAKAGRVWFRPIARRFEKIGVQLLVLSFITSTLALATPLFVKAVFDQVIAAKSLNTLAYLSIGIGLALACNAIIRYMRSSLLAHVGGRMDNIVNNSVIDKMIDLPLVKLERASVGAQLSRLREFEGLRGFFAGPIAVSLLELPFVIIYLTAIAILGGVLAFVPLVLILVLGTGAYISLRYSKAAVADAIGGNADCQSTLIEILENLRFIKDEGTEDLWLERYRARSTQLALANLEAMRINTRFQTFSQAIMMTAGAVTLTVGAVLSANGDFTVGSLIACMALVWRVLSPLQTLFVTFTRLEEVKSAINRINQLMSQPSETQIRSSGETIAREREFEGKISFQKVMLRYAANNEPALAGISFNAQPGELVAIVGSNGSGKSTIMKLIANLYKPQSGTVKIDDIDTRQLNLLDLRNSIGYLPQKSDLFAGTIEENLKVANPVATRAELEAVLEEAGVLDDVQNLPHGINTLLTEQTTKQVSTGFRKGLTLARTFLCKSNIMLFDEPSVGLDVESDEMLKRKMESYRGKVTTLYVTHRPDYVKLADRVIALKNGQITFNGTPAELAKQGKKVSMAKGAER